MTLQFYPTQLSISRPISWIMLNSSMHALYLILSNLSLSIYLMYLSIYATSTPSFCHSFLSVCLPVCLSFYLSMIHVLYASIYMSFRISIKVSFTSSMHLTNILFPQSIQLYPTHFLQSLSIQLIS